MRNKYLLLSGVVTGILAAACGDDGATNVTVPSSISGSSGKLRSSILPSSGVSMASNNGEFRECF